MRGNYKNRLLTLAERVVYRRAAWGAGEPFFAFDDTPPEEIRAARREGHRPIFYARKVGPGQFEVVEDSIPACVKWATLQDCPTSGIRCLDVNLETEEVTERPHFEGWMRPEEADMEVAQYEQQ